MKDKGASLSIIDKGLNVEGTLNADGKLIIIGTLKGTLIGNAIVTAKGSRVTAEARVENIVIAGEFQGDVTAYNSLQILKTGNFAGNITCKSLSLEAGGKLNGHVRPLEAQDGVFPLSDIQAPTIKN